MLEVAPTVLISTDFAPHAQALTPAWWYLVPEFGQHIGFLRESTLDRIARELGCRYATDGRSVHLLSRDGVGLRRWAALRRFTGVARTLTRGMLQSRTNTDFDLARRRMASHPRGLGLQCERDDPV